MHAILVCIANLVFKANLSGNRNGNSVMSNVLCCLSIEALYAPSEFLYACCEFCNRSALSASSFICALSVIRLCKYAVRLNHFVNALQALDRSCSAEHTCKSCSWSGCWPIKNYHNYHIEEHGEHSWLLSPLIQCLLSHSFKSNPARW